MGPDHMDPPPGYATLLLNDKEIDLTLRKRYMNDQEQYTNSKLYVRLHLHREYDVGWIFICN